MSDDKTKIAPQDSSRVSVNEDYELFYWTKRFGITKDELKEAVKAVGTSVSALERHLKIKS